MLVAWHRGGLTIMRLKEFMETDIYKLADIAEYINKNGEEVEENEEKLLLYDVITHHKSHQQTGFIEIQLDME